MSIYGTPEQTLAAMEQDYAENGPTPAELASPDYWVELAEHAGTDASAERMLAYADLLKAQQVYAEKVAAEQIANAGWLAGLLAPLSV